MPDKVFRSSIQFNFLNQPAALKDRKKLKAFILSMVKKEKKALGSLSYIFCSDEYLLSINKQFLRHDYYTDIITFNLAEKNQPIEGEIYISVDRVTENATSFNQAKSYELHRVIFHGVLHLCGYRDKRGDEIALMRKKENQYLSLYFK